MKSEPHGWFVYLNTFCLQSFENENSANEYLDNITIELEKTSIINYQNSNDVSFSQDTFHSND